MSSISLFIITRGVAIQWFFSRVTQARHPAKHAPSVSGRFFTRHQPPHHGSFTMHKESTSTDGGIIHSGSNRSVGTGLEEVQQRGHRTRGEHERAERLHEEIRPQSSTGFMTPRRSFCLYKLERETIGQRGVYSEYSFVKRIFD